MRLTTNTDRLVVQVTPRWPVWAIALVAGGLLLVFALDRFTGSAPVQHLYYLPIILAAVGFGMTGGTLAAVMSVTLYHAANPHLLTFRYEESDLVQIAIFLSVGIVTAKLRLDANRLRHLAMTDDLTGLHNLRSFEERLATMLRISRQEQLPIALAVLDVDRLKSLNDRYGHLTGAEAVRTIGRLIGRRLPPGAVACRYGGDEFAIAIPRCTSPMVREFAEGVCHAVHDLAPMLSDRAFQAGTLSVSIGACSARLEHWGPSHAGPSRDAEAGEALFHIADVALYRAKASGGNRVSVTDEGPTSRSSSLDHSHAGQPSSAQAANGLAGAEPTSYFGGASAGGSGSGT